MARGPSLALLAGLAAASLLCLRSPRDGPPSSSGRRALRAAGRWLDPKTVAPRLGVGKAFLSQFEGSGQTYFAVSGWNQVDGEPLPEVLIEVQHPKPDKKYSVTVVAQGKYTGTAMLLTNEGGVAGEPLVYSWKPLFPAEYQILVHEIHVNPGSKKSPLVQPSPLSMTIGAGEGFNVKKTDVLTQLFQHRLEVPPCQTLRNADAFSHWEGDWLGPEFQLPGLDKIRTGWSFLPSRQMNCRLETFSHEDLLAIPTKKSIYVIGTSKERGVYLSMVDLLLSNEDKEDDALHKSVIGKCWGRAVVEKGNLKVLYQDFRVKEFEPPLSSGYIECHNDNVVHDGDSSFIKNATVLWQEVFQEEASWPDVIYLLSGYGWGEFDTFDFESHTLAFVKMLPPTWSGVLLIQDGQFSAAEVGLKSLDKYEKYRSDLREMLAAMNDPRVRWIDGMGVSKDHRMYSAKGPEATATSAHFHYFCRWGSGPVVTPSGEITEANRMKVCSNITETVAQLLIGHALGPKEQFLETVRQTPMDPNRDLTLRICHNCPQSLFPFHITPYPEMTCESGPLHQRTVDEIAAVAEAGPKVCPDYCLGQDPTFTMPSESDVIHVRQCQKAVQDAPQTQLVQ